MLNNNKRLFLFSLLGVFFLFSCQSYFKVSPNYTNYIGETDAGTSLKAYVGDVLYTKYAYKSRMYTRSSGEIKCGWNCAITWVDSIFLSASVNGKFGACGIGMSSMTGQTNICLIDNDRDGYFERFALPTQERNLDNKVKYVLSDSDEMDGIKKELIYQGIDDETLRFRYREYFKDLVRPAYDQTVEYNLTQDKIVSFRGMRILIEDANNQDITYKIISGSIAL